MAGARDRPEDRARRDAAAEIPPPPDDPDRRTALEAAATPVLSPRGKGLKVMSLSGSGMRLRLDDRREVAQIRMRRQAWQSEAWGYFKECPEFAYACMLTGSLMSKVRLFAATRVEAQDAPVPVLDPDSGVDPTVAKIAVEALARLRSRQGGQRSLIRLAAINLDVAAEAFLHGHTDPVTGDEEWTIRSVHELVVEGDRYALRIGPGGHQLDPIPADDVVSRLWDADPEFSALSFCLTRSCLAELEALLLLSREVRATAKARALRGILLYPSELSLGPMIPAADGDEDAEADPFVARFMEALTTAIADEGSAAAMAPILISGAADLLKEVRLVPLTAPLDAALDARIEARVIRLARGMNWPVETITGLMQTTFANAASIERHEFDAHLEPRCVTLCDALTSGYYRDALEEAGIPSEIAEDLFIWFDPTDLIAVPDQAEQAQVAHEKGLISGDAARQYLGYTEADKPEPAELLLQVLLDSARRMDPFIQGQLLVSLGLAPATLELPAPQNGTVPANEPQVDAPESIAATLVPVASRPAPAALPAEMVAAGGRRSHRRDAARLGRRLAGIDRDLRTRLHVAAEAAMRRALERAGAKVQRALERGGKSERASAARAAVDGVAARDMAGVLGRAVTEALTAAAGDPLDGAFDDLMGEYEAWVNTATLQALAEVEDYLGAPLSAAERTEFVQRSRAGVDAGVEWFHTRLRTLAADRLYNPAPGVPPLGEADVAFTVPEGLIRSAVALAGGGAETPTPGQGGVATGPLVINVATSDGTQVDGYVWDYGTVPRAAFEPHLDLDGEQFVNWDDDVLLNDTGWPDAYCYPGDHEGCGCNTVPVLISPDEYQAEPVVTAEGDGGE